MNYQKKVKSERNIGNKRLNCKTSVSSMKDIGTNMYVKPGSSIYLECFIVIKYIM